MEVEQIAQDLVSALQGDLAAFAQLMPQSHETLLAARATLPPLVLGPASVRKVLEALRNRQATPELVQRWAFFVRHEFIGYWQSRPITDADRLQEKRVGHHLVAIQETIPKGPIKPLDIDWDSMFEDQIAEIISRLDEIGDLIDGEVTDDEIRAMLTTLTE